MLTVLTLGQPRTAQAQTGVAGVDGKPYCREYTETVMVGGVRQEAYGTACLQPDGSWMKRPDAERLSGSAPQVSAPVQYVVVKDVVVRDVVRERAPQYYGARRGSFVIYESRRAPYPRYRADRHGHFHGGRWW